MVNITDDDIWNAEPALRPEDEIVLRKLHDMLQSTADDLKLLSGELSKYHEPGVQVKSLPTPLDEEFNEKVHIEELVNAKFHGYKVIDKPQSMAADTRRDTVNRFTKTIATEPQKPNKVFNTGIYVNRAPTLKKHLGNLKVARTKHFNINENASNVINNTKENNGQQKQKSAKPKIAYKELSFTHEEPTLNAALPKPLQVQNMPSINIRSELKKQKVLNLDIEPVTIVDDCGGKDNVTVISVQHKPVPVASTNLKQVQSPIVPTATFSTDPQRKVSKMSSCESSEIDSHQKCITTTHVLHKIRPHRSTKPINKITLRQHSENIKTKTNVSSKKEPAKQSKFYLDIWKKKLNTVYNCPTSSVKSKLIKSENKAKSVESKVNATSNGQPITHTNNLHYIPYSKLTLGGVRVSDIDKELSDIPNRNDITLGPILNKILSRENSFHMESPPTDKSEDCPKIPTISDDKLLHEVLDIKNKVTKTLTKNFTENNVTLKKDQILYGIDEQNSYDDDFEDENDYSIRSKNESEVSNKTNSAEISISKSSHDNTSDKSFQVSNKKENLQKETCTKKLNLSFKDNVDVFEFVHNIDTQETGTQSNTTQIISLKETQTSPRNEKCNVHPIRNDLWPPLDPKGEVEKLFQLEKDFIKKLIIDEYGDLLEKKLNKPSTSKDNQDNAENNVAASQKNTQTSPAHVKSVMTSPTRTKTRTTSPFAVSLTVEQQTSPMRDELNINIDDGDDLGISINLSSPRFNLRLPKTSREVISNLESHARSKESGNKNNTTKGRAFKSTGVVSSSSADGRYSSSDMSSFGEIKYKLKRRLRKFRVPSISELSSSASLSNSSSDISESIVPLRSEGEVVSLGQVNIRKHIQHSEGEASLGCLYN